MLPFPGAEPAAEGGLVSDRCFLVWYPDVFSAGRSLAAADGGVCCSWLSRADQPPLADQGRIDSAVRLVVCSRGQLPVPRRRLRRAFRRRHCQSILSIACRALGLMGLHDILTASNAVKTVLAADHQRHPLGAGVRRDRTGSNGVLAAVMSVRTPSAGGIAGAVVGRHACLRLIVRWTVNIVGARLRLWRLYYFWKR